MLASPLPLPPSPPSPQWVGGWEEEIVKEDNPEQKFMLLIDVARMEWDEDLRII